MARIVKKITLNNRRLLKIGGTKLSVVGKEVGTKVKEKTYS